MGESKIVQIIPAPKDLYATYTGGEPADRVACLALVEDADGR